MLLLRFYRDMVKGNCSCGSVGGMVAFVAMEATEKEEGIEDVFQVVGSPLGMGLIFIFIVS